MRAPAWRRHLGKRGNLGEGSGSTYSGQCRPHGATGKQQTADGRRTWGEGDYLILIDTQHAGIFLNLRLQEILESSIYFVSHLSMGLEKHAKEGDVLEGAIGTEDQPRAVVDLTTALQV